MNKYEGYTLSWANGRLQWAMDALDHIEAHGLLPVDGRPMTLATDLPAICYVLGEKADHNPMVQRVRTALKNGIYYNNKHFASFGKMVARYSSLK